MRRRRPVPETTLTLHDICTQTPLTLSSASHASLISALAGVPKDTARVGMTLTDANGGEIGVAVAARIGDHWTVGAALDKKKAGPLEVEGQVQYSW
jgi:hypothetical protein